MESNHKTASPLVKEVLLDAPAERIWKAITNKDEMKKWYFDIREFKAEPGFEFSFIGENEGRKFVHLCKVLEVEVNKKLSHSWRYENEPGDTIVTWELFPEGERTRLRLTHTGLESLPQTKDYKKENFVEGWNHILGISLPKYIGQ